MPAITFGGAAIPASATPLGSPAALHHPSSATPSGPSPPVFPPMELPVIPQFNQGELVFTLSPQANLVPECSGSSTTPSGSPAIHLHPPSPFLMVNHPSLPDHTTPPPPVSTPPPLPLEQDVSLVASSGDHDVRMEVDERP